MKDFRLFIDQQRQFYRSIVSINCPVLNNTVFFTSEGFTHLIYESNLMPRKLSEQYLKLINLKYVPTIVSKSTKIIEIRCGTRKIKGKIKNTIGYELVGFCGNKKIGVIVERVGFGKFTFKSVIPYYKRKKTKKLP